MTDWHSPEKIERRRTGYAPDSVDFTADHRVLFSAFGDSALLAVAVMGASASLRFVRGAYRRSDGKLDVIVRDPEHQLLGPFVARLLGQDARFFRSLVPLFGAVEVLRFNGHGTHP